MSQVLKLFGFHQDALKSTGPLNLPDVQYYFQSGNPVVCLKKVVDFGSKSLREIHEIKQKLWNYGKIPFFYVYSDVEIRIYDCLEKPVRLEEMAALGETPADDGSKLNALLQVFSAQALDTGSLWNQPEGEPFRKKINTKNRIDAYLIQCLEKIMDELRGMGLNPDLIHRLILRSLFLLFLEDRGATDENFYRKISPRNVRGYFDILDNIQETYSLFRELERHFNGNVFTVEQDEESQIRKKHLAVVKRYFQNGFEENNLFPDFRLFRFEIIPIELISGIYERLLKSMDARQNRATGTYYTPPALVELVLDNKLPADSVNYEMRILDPACGSGIFLVESFQRLVRRYEKAHGEKPQSFETLKTLLVDHIFGIEINFQSIKVAAFSLYLALLENLEPKTFWQEDSCRFPYLIDAPGIPPEKRGKNLYCRDAIVENEEIDRQSFDLIVGNPPFGRLFSEMNKSASEYCCAQNFAPEYSLPFLHKAVKWCPAGEIAFLFPVSILMNTRGSYANFRSWLFEKCYVEEIYNFSVLRKTPENFGGSLFESATVPIGIVFYRNSPVEFPDRIRYYAPKTYIKSNNCHGILIERCDVRYIRREDCADTRIWKIAMWGGEGDFALFKRLDRRFRTLREMVDRDFESWITGTGFHKASQQRIREGRAVSIPEKIMDTERISRFYTDRNALRREEKPCNPHDLSRFTPPFVLTKEGQTGLRFGASLVDFPAAFLSSAFAIKCIDDDRKNKVLCALINSDFGEYFLRMVSPSWGIERERVIFGVLMLLPDIFEKASEKELDAIVTMTDRIIEQKKQLLSDSEDLESQLNEYLFSTILKLSDREKFAVQDALKYNLDMFLHQSKSIAMKPITEEIRDEYARVLCNTINEFLEIPHFAKPTLYSLSPPSTLMMIKVNFSEQPGAKTISRKNVSRELKKLETFLWEAHGNIYLRKTLNYYSEEDVYLIRPNQQRFWTKSMAIEDAESLILELGGTEE